MIEDWRSKNPKNVAVFSYVAVPVVSVDQLYDKISIIKPIEVITLAKN